MHIFIHTYIYIYIYVYRLQSATASSVHGLVAIVAACTHRTFSLSCTIKSRRIFFGEYLTRKNNFLFKLCCYMIEEKYLSTIVYTAKEPPAKKKTIRPQQPPASTGSLRP